LENFGQPIVFTYPNSDAGGLAILDRMKDWVSRHPNSRIVSNLGTTKYYSLMSYAAVMVGNSSSGIVEAASFALPVVNIGARQQGRPCPRNILNVGFDAKAIAEAISSAIAPAFKNDLQGLTNPFGDGNASERITQVLADTEIDERLLIKRYL
jgi:UDP-N-acetylglucosamine 2-epimerase